MKWQPWQHGHVAVIPPHFSTSLSFTHIIENKTYLDNNVVLTVCALKKLKMIHETFYLFEHALYFCYNLKNKVFVCFYYNKHNKTMWSFVKCQYKCI